MKLKVKLVCGYRKDQEHIISIDEAHKAYYLFIHPDKRAVFSDGLALKGDQIQTILPAYQATLGWSDVHTLDSDDMNEIRKIGVDAKLQRAMQFASDVAKLGKQADLSIPLPTLKSKYPELLLAPSKGARVIFNDIPETKQLEA